MTAAQLAIEYAKLPRVYYDSDEEPVHAQTHTIAAQAESIVDLTTSLLDTDDLDDLYDLGVERVIDNGNRHATGGGVGGCNPDSMVQDPFNPLKRCTLQERDELLQDEQEYREAHGMPLLVQHPDDHEYWIEPCEVNEPIHPIQPIEPIEPHEADTVAVKLEFDDEACARLSFELFGPEPEEDV